MALYTKGQLRQISATETMNEFRNFTNLSALDRSSFDIFLCHSYLDKEIVKGLYLDLTRKGHTVYVDWIVDRDLDRSNVTKQAAERIRRRLGCSRSLLLAFSTNAGLSKWIPWELGVVDGARQSCAIVPVTDIDGEAYERAEYLQLYPMVERYQISYSSEKQLYVSESASRFVSVSDWIKGSKPTEQSFRLR